MKLQHVPARQGLVWVRSGIRAFIRQPLAMAGLFFLFMMAVSLLSVLPVVGTLAALALLPAATVGLMSATREADQGRFPMPVLLASAFRAGKAQTLNMLQLGAMYAVGFLAVMGASALVDGGGFAQLYLGGGTVDNATVMSEDFQGAMAVGMLLYLPLSMLFWHAPALVHWHGVSPVKSLFFSWVACWRNKWAFAVYMLGWLAFFVVAGLLVTILGGVLGGGSWLLSLIYPLVLLMAAMFFTSFYYTYRDSFSES